MIKKTLAGKISGSKREVSFDKPVSWTNDMSVEEATIDSQHKNLIDGINKLLEATRSGEEVKKVRELIHFMNEYVNKHFSYEEAYMKKINYPKLDDHKEIHRSFVEYYVEFKKNLDRYLYEKKDSEPVSEKILNLLKEAREDIANWLVNHMLGDDQEFHDYAKKNNLIEKNWKKKIKKSEVVAKKSTKKKSKKTEIVKEYVFTGIEGFDALLGRGIPKGCSIIVAGGAGSGKTILCLQTLFNKARKGKKCLYMTLEESEERLIHHMDDFGWDATSLIEEGNLKIMRINPFDITRNVDAMLAKQKGELLIDIDPVLLPDDYSNPDFIVIDSLTAIASAFTGKEDSYRIYIEQLFRFLEKTKANNFLITETEQVPKIYSTTGVEEFLADGVVVIYSLKHGNVREKALEILKLRGSNHKKNIVAMQITDEGITIYPEQEVFSDI